MIEFLVGLASILAIILGPIAVFLSLGYLLELILYGLDLHRDLGYHKPKKEYISSRKGMKITGSRNITDEPLDAAVNGGRTVAGTFAVIIIALFVADVLHELGTFILTTVL